MSKKTRHCIIVSKTCLTLLFCPFRLKIPRFHRLFQLFFQPKLTCNALARCNVTVFTGYDLQHFVLSILNKKNTKQRLLRNPVKNNTSFTPDANTARQQILPSPDCPEASLSRLKLSRKAFSVLHFSITFSWKSSFSSARVARDFPISSIKKSVNDGRLKYDIFF